MAKRVLIVDDDYFFKKLLGSVFCEMGCEVSTVSDGVEAMTMLGESGFDLAVLDYHIPGVGPTRIVAHLRARAVEIPLIVVTADDSAATEREARALGVAYYFVKPFPMADLRAVAETIFASTGRPHSRVKR